MNRMLATVLEVVNIFTAIAIIAGCSILGARMFALAGETAIIGLVVGAVIGAFIAAVICGVIALLTLIEKHLNFMASSAEFQNVVTKMQIDHRIEPRI
ncbi:MAG: hypothetical protein V7774_07840 [Pseudorhizobium pelagicum]|uniref:hypothetical protein n=1 Tax=Pseudorhizobium pelagicum TaxID=1509405 RepID=UPI0034616B4D